MSAFSNKAKRVHRSAEPASEVVKIGLDAVNVVLGLDKVLLPLVGGVCAVARDVLNDVRKFHDRADDVIAAGRRVVNVLQTLQCFAEDTKKLQPLARYRVKRRMHELERLLSALREAVRAFGRPGFFKKMFRAAKEAKTLKRLDRDIREALDMLRVAYDLGRDEKFDQLLENQRYALEEAIENQIQERINMGDADAVEGLENDMSAIETIAIQGGVSDEVFLRELGEFSAEVRDNFNRFGHSLRELRNEVQQLKTHSATQRECTDDMALHHEHLEEICKETRLVLPGQHECDEGRLAQHGEHLEEYRNEIKQLTNQLKCPDEDLAKHDHVAVTHANPDELPYMQSIIGRGIFGVTHKMRAVIDRRECAVKLISLAMAGFSVSEDELFMEVTLLLKLKCEYIVKYKEVRVVMTPWLGKCLAIIMEFVPGGTLLERMKSSSKVDLETTSNWLRQLASALAHIHSCRIQHHDFKLDNVLLDAQGDVRPPVPF